MTDAPAKRGFAAMTPETQQAIASKGGASVPNDKRSFSQNRELAREAGRKGGKSSGGNFARNPQRASEAGRKGGQVGSGNFARNPERAAESGRKGAAVRNAKRGSE